MSLMRMTQILEQEMAQGWTALRVDAAAPGIEAVKATPGKVARLLVLTPAIDVTPLDGAAAAWDVVTSAAELNLVGTPMAFDTSIGLQFSAAGSAWILYR